MSLPFFLKFSYGIINKMCFSIPAKVIQVIGNSAVIEGGKKVTLGKEIKVGKGDYLQISGDIAVGKLSPAEGLKIRQLIKKLND